MSNRSVSQSMEPYRYAGDELSVFAHARQWKHYVGSLIDYALVGNVLEVGAGIGSSTVALRSDRQASWTCMEPDVAMAEALAQNAAFDRLPVRVVRGTTADLAADERYDAVLYLDVLEHVQDDRGELARAAAHLTPAGRLIVLSPAHQWLFTPFDERIGHWRRYSRRTLRDLAPAGLAVERLAYLDAAGLLLSTANRLVLRSASPSVGQVRTWDRWFVPVSRLVDPVLGHHVGKSLLAIWRKRDP
jgi:SAM-dependent methyltransferase